MLSEFLRPLSEFLKPLSESWGRCLNLSEAKLLCCLDVLRPLPEVSPEAELLCCLNFWGHCLNF